MSLKMGKSARAMLMARLDGTIHGLRWEWEQNRLRNIYDAGRKAADTGTVCPYTPRSNEWCSWHEGRDDERFARRVAEERYGLGYMQGRGAA